MPPDNLDTTLRTLLLQSGACACAVIPVEVVETSEMNRYRRWIADGCHGSMHYLEQYDDVRSDPALLLDGARSMIICAFSYRHHEQPNDDGLLIAHYAQGDDYHTVIHRQLVAVGEAICRDHSDASWRVCVDTAPLRERYWAHRAGLTITGVNCTAIIPGIGSQFFIGTLLTTLPLTPMSGHIITPGGGFEPVRLPSDCGKCGACLRACPCGALRGDGTLDARRCINYLTIEHRGELPADTNLGHHLYGCDSCQNACPHNRITPESVRHITPDPFAQRPALATLTAEDITTMTGGAYKRLTAGSAMRRITLAQLRRNLDALDHRCPHPT